MGATSRNLDRIVMWSLIVAFVAASGVAKSRQPCACTAIRCGQNNICISDEQSHNNLINDVVILPWKH